jgi:hypothetical protein
MLFIYILFIFLISCVVSSHKLTEEDKLYKNKCTSCHALRNSKKYSAEVWGKIVAKHRNENRLNLIESDWQKIKELNK